MKRHWRVQVGVRGASCLRGGVCACVCVCACVYLCVCVCVCRPRPKLVLHCIRRTPGALSDRCVGPRGLVCARAWLARACKAFRMRVLGQDNKAGDCLTKPMWSSAAIPWPGWELCTEHAARACTCTPCLCSAHGLQSLLQRPPRGGPHSSQAPTHTHSSETLCPCMLGPQSLLQRPPRGGPHSSQAPTHTPQSTHVRARADQEHGAHACLTRSPRRSGRRIGAGAAHGRHRWHARLHRGPRRPGQIQHLHARPAVPAARHPAPAHW